MDSIKKFFEKKKKDVKFKMAGEGRAISSSTPHPVPSSSKAPSGGGRFVPSNESRRAGAAALARKQEPPKEIDWSMQAIRAQARREIEAEKKLAEGPATQSEDCQEQTPATLFDVQGVHFHCPLLGDDSAPYDEIKSRIRDFLFSQLGDDKAVAACLIIHTCNKNQEKIRVCVETLCKYVENISSNPNEPKYRRIRVGNRAFQDRVAPIEGAEHFLEAAGFGLQTDNIEGKEEKFWVLPSEEGITELESIRDTLVSAEAVRPQLSRSAKLLRPEEAAKENPDLPPEFFNLTVDELKREMQQRKDALERSEVLMTKAMREKHEMREMRKYRFSLIRIRLPNGLTLQGTFSVRDTFGDVVAFVREKLHYEWRPFFLVLSGGSRITEENLTLSDLKMAPAVILNFEWDPEIQDPNLDNELFLKAEAVEQIT